MEKKKSLIPKQIQTPDRPACSTSLIQNKVQAFVVLINPLNAKLNPICHLLALLGRATIVVVSRLRVKRTSYNSANDTATMWKEN